MLQDLVPFSKQRPDRISCEEKEHTEELDFFTEEVEAEIGMGVSVTVCRMVSGSAVTVTCHCIVNVNARGKQLRRVSADPML
jgi:hypothetical protein